MNRDKQSVCTIRIAVRINRRRKEENLNAEKRKKRCNCKKMMIMKKTKPPCGNTRIFCSQCLEISENFNFMCENENAVSVHMKLYANFQLP